MKHRPDTLERLQALCKINRKMLLTPKDLCGIFGVNSSTIHKWEDAGNLPEPEINRATYAVKGRSRLRKSYRVCEVLEIFTKRVYKPD